MLSFVLFLAAAPPVHVLKVHVYADSSLSGWEPAAAAMIDAAQKQVDARLLLKRRSTFDAGAAPTLEQALVKLEQHDPGGEADIVVGLLPAGEGATVHDVARARSPGRHVVMRFGRDAAMVFLHEWAHLLGAIDASAGVMNPLQPIGKFSRADRELIGIGLAHFPALLTDPNELAAYKREATIYVRANEKAFDSEALVAALAWLQTEARDAAPLPEIAGLWLKEATEHTDNAKIVLAWEAINKLQEHAYHPHVAALWCRLALLRTEPDARERCRLAAEKNPLDPMTLLMRANSELTARDANAAATTLVRVAAVIDRAPVATKVWDYFGTLAQSAGCITFAERAALSTGGERLAQVTEWATLARRRAAIPAGLRGGDECRLQAELTPALDRMDAKQFAAARELAQRAENAHPKAAAPLALICEALTQEKNDAAAEPVCIRALEAAPEASVAQYCLGVIAFRRGDRAAAAKRFARVLELDPEAGHAKTMLERSR